MVAREILMLDLSEGSLGVHKSKYHYYEIDNGETIIVDCTPLPAPPMTPIAEALIKDRKETEATRRKEEKRKAAENKATKLAALEATKHFYYHPNDHIVFVRNAADIVSDILYMVRVLGMLEEEEDPSTPKVPNEMTPKQRLELYQRENPLFKTNFPTHHHLPIRIYVKPADTPQHKVRPLPSHWGPVKRKEWGKFCKRKRKEGRTIISERHERERKRANWARRKARGSDYFWEWRTDIRGGNQWVFVREEHGQNRDEIYVPVVPDELKGPKLRAKDSAAGNGSGSGSGTHWRQDGGSKGYASSGGMRKSGRSSEVENKWVHWRDKLWV